MFSRNHQLLSDSINSQTHFILSSKPEISRRIITQQVKEAEELAKQQRALIRVQNKMKKAQEIILKENKKAESAKKKAESAKKKEDIAAAKLQLKNKKLISQKTRKMNIKKEPKYCNF